MTRLQIQVAETNPLGVFAANVKGSRATPSVAHAKQTLRSTRKTIADPSQQAACWEKQPNCLQQFWNDILILNPTTNCLLECMNWGILSFPQDVHDVINATSTQNLNS